MPIAAEISINQAFISAKTPKRVRFAIVTTIVQMSIVRKDNLPFFPSVENILSNVFCLILAPYITVYFKSLLNFIN
jgi:hypothetical protein